MTSCNKVAKPPFSDQLTTQNWRNCMEGRLHLAKWGIYFCLAHQFEQLRSGPVQMGGERERRRTRTTADSGSFSPLDIQVQ